MITIIISPLMVRAKLVARAHRPRQEGGRAAKEKVAPGPDLPPPHPLTLRGSSDLLDIGMRHPHL